MSPPRILCVTDDVPWPGTSGYRIRLATVVRALARVGSVDLWAAIGDERDIGALGAPAELGLSRISVVRVRHRSGMSRFLHWCTSRLPRGVLDHDRPAARSDLEGWVELPYDLVWFGHLQSYAAFGRSVAGPAIVDIDNLWDWGLRDRRRVLSDRTRRNGSRARARSLFARLADRIDARRYTRLHGRVSARAEAIAVCSELDRRRLGEPNTVVVPNGYPAPVPPATLHHPDLSAPRVLMVGLFTYAPNADAARFFVERVLPLVRAELPGARARLVGHHDGSLDDLATVPGVELVGAVADVDDELRDADVVIVPLRYGGGTRLKILEAFAYRVPVVSTSVGCEGLEVTPGEHLLVADDADGLASACFVALRDPVLRTALTDAAFTLFETRASSAAVEEAIANIGRGLITDPVGDVESAHSG